MYYLQKMCFLCLEATEAHLRDFSSMDENGLRHCDKIAAFSTIVNAVELHSNNPLCEKCIDIIDMIYNFNRDCLRNIERYNSYKMILQGDSEVQQRCDGVSVKIKKLENLNSQSMQTIQIKTKNETCSEISCDKDINITDYIVTKSKVKVPKQTIVQPEVEDAIPTFDGNNDSKLINVTEIETRNEEITASHLTDYIVKESEAESSEQGIVKSELDHAVSTIDGNNDFEVIYVSEIKIENEETTDYQSTDNIVMKNEVEVSNEVIVKSEVDEIGPSYDDNIESDSKIKLNIVETDIKQECWGKDEEKFIRFEEKTWSSSKVAVENEEDLTSELKDDTRYDTEEIFIDINIHSSDKLYTCDICKKVFSRKSLLNCHKLSHGMKGFSCKECGKLFTHKRYLIVHTRTHTGDRPFTCDSCDKAFVNKSNLVQHKRTHTGEKPYSCDVCKKSFSHTSSMNAHILIHSGKKPHECDICKKVFSQKSNLKIHKLIHSGVKSFFCSQCNKSFAHKHVLESHERLHTGEKPYACNICHKAFVRKSLLTQHKRTHTGEKPYTCDLCNKSFTRKFTLNKHKKTHNNE